jgi:hypothetical protein
LLYH